MKTQDQYKAQLSILSGKINGETDGEVANALTAAYNALLAEYQSKFFNDHGGRLVPRDLEPGEIDDYLDLKAETSPVDYDHDDDCPIQAAERRMGA